jgi:cytochrome c oxidase cbb3-type subunit I/II
MSATQDAAQAAATDADEGMGQPYRDREAGPTETVTYDDQTPKYFAIASIGWGIVGMLVGVIVALQLAFAGANVHPMLSFGRLRPLHTNAVIFAFVGNMVFAGIYHSTQRLLRTRTASDLLSKIHFWGWQAIIVAAAVTLPLGLTQGKEYAELEWPIDLAITVVWVVFAINFFWTLARRNEKHLYVAIWFYIATIVTVAILHLVNSLAIPVTFGKSYSVYGGAQDALVQWWYGHNAVAFFLTTPVLGIMYYYLPKAAQRPVFSYRLSIVHFWALIFVYIWAGPHHLLYTALPEWAQTLGMVFSVMLWAPSWGGMLNGLLTLRGGWSQLRTDPVLKFFAAGVTFYGMATFEGPLLSIRSVSGLAHYTDWIIGHVHSGALGWNGFMAAGLFYFLLPRLVNKKLYSNALADAHFWIGTAGILIYMLSMWVSGVTQGLMWRAEKPDGSLAYPTFVETLIAIKPMYHARLLGGTLYLLGMVLMAYNLAKTVWGEKSVVTTVKVVPLAPSPQLSWRELVFGKPVLLVVAVLILAGAGITTNMFAGPLFSVLAMVVTLFSLLGFRAATASEGGGFHRLLEGRALIFVVMTAVSVLIGGVVELVPALIVRPAEIAKNEVTPYRALELEGRDVYVQEGCYTCHSQMIRPMHFETARYGAVSEMKDSVYDHPFQWGSKRTGPDLAREGSKYPNLWHYRHMINPREITEGSNMPAYAHLKDDKIDLNKTQAKLGAMRSVGVPYTDQQIADATADAQKQGQDIVADLKKEGATIEADTKLVALIAYLQRLGREPPKPAAMPVAGNGGGAQEPPSDQPAKAAPAATP